MEGCNKLFEQGNDVGKTICKGRTLCPDCKEMEQKFNWKVFHKDLDVAMAILIQESQYPNIFLPSKVSLMDFAKITNNKRKELEESQ